MTEPQRHAGRCLCGAVTFAGLGPVKAVHCCHCRDCARWNGGPLITADFAEGIEVEGPVRWFASSEWAERGSCERCGSALLWRLRDGSMINVSAGALDDQTIIRGVDEHIYVDSKPAYYDFADDAPRLTAAQHLERLKP
ncbi:MAG: GFA family protein [Alphaproteobacteria bacterium]|nr:GFA family protein [Alphaproteobacteria bacterium]